MALKFDFSKLRSAMLGFLTPTDALGTALTAGEEAVYVPKMRLGFQVVDMSGNVTLTAEDSGKIFHINGGGAYQVTLPTAPEDGLWYRFVNTEVTPSGAVTIAAGSAIIAGPAKDVGGDIGAGTGGTEVSNVLFSTDAEIGDNIELISVGGFYVMMHGGSSIAAGLTTS
tara:strand:- start:30046 stop:30552 length:507 start_codon:yes stop_codon:yes gene_type:complete